MKSPGELTELETTKVRLAQANLKDAAIAFAMARAMGRTDLDLLDELFMSARAFDSMCEDVGLHEYWKPGPLLTVKEFINPDPH